jgi:hypothetical protein
MKLPLIALVLVATPASASNYGPDRSRRQQCSG